MRTLLNRAGSPCGLRLAALGVPALGLFAALAIAPSVRAGTIWAVDNQDNLFSFDNSTPNDIQTGHFITGLQANEQILQIDFAPNGNLYGLSSFNQVYQLNTGTGAATLPASFSPPTLNGNHFGFDINPTNSAGRIVSDADQNLSVSITTSGPATVNTTLSYATGDVNQGKNPSVVALGYMAVGGTTLYGIDTNRDVLVSFNSETAGTLHTVGPLGVDATGLTGMDIASSTLPGPITTNVAFANIELPGSSVSDLYAINLTTGLATDQGRIVDGVQVRDIAAELGETFIVPEPASAMILLSAGALLSGRRKRTA